jgi:hypothetical protein
MPGRLALESGARASARHNEETPMAWERRMRGGPYYTRSRRVGGRVVREYFGRGPAAVATYREDLERRRNQERQRAAWAQEREQLRQVDELAARMERAANQILHAVLYGAGFHLHKRGEWMRRRGGTGEDSQGDKAAIRQRSERTDVPSTPG